METLTVDKLENPADVLVEFIETLAKIKIDPKRAEANKTSMTTPDGSIITY